MRHIHRNVSKELLFQASSSLDIELLFSRVYLAVQVWCFISRLNDSSRVLECVDNFTGSLALGLSAWAVSIRVSQALSCGMSVTAWCLHTTDLSTAHSSVKEAGIQSNMLIAKPVRGQPSINRSEHPWWEQLQVVVSRSGYGAGGHCLVVYFLWVWVTGPPLLLGPLRVGA